MVSERGASAMCRIKNLPEDFNVLNSIKQYDGCLTDSINHITMLNEFVSANDSRQARFGIFMIRICMSCNVKCLMV